MKRRTTIQERILSALDPIEGTSALDIAVWLNTRRDGKVNVRQVSAALQRLRRSGRAENGYGSLGYSWFRTKVTDDAKD